MADLDPRSAYTHSRTRSKSSFSFKSVKSDSSDPAQQRVNPEDLKETEAARRKAKWAALETTKDPNKAISEFQPADRARVEASTLPTLRNGQMRDWKGEVISDPDASNPTRSRMERPLDTIRSFEAAIDNGYKRKQKLARSESADFTAQSSRRSSFVGGNENYYQRHSATPVGAYGHGGQRGHPGYRENYGPRPSAPRHSTAPSGHYHGQDHANYPSHAYRESYDTVGTGESYNTSGSEPWTNSTNPSSENSSVDRINGVRADYNDAYGNSYGQGYNHGSSYHDTIHEEYGQDGYDHGPNQYEKPYVQPRPPQQHARAGGQQGQPSTSAQNHQQQQELQFQQQAQAQPQPHPPLQSQPALQKTQRKPIQLGGESTAPTPPAHGARLQRPPPPPKKNSSDDGKRKSWLRRRFSKG